MARTIRAALTPWTRRPAGTPGGLRDPLTGVLSRQAVEELLGGVAALADRLGTPIFALVVDVDRLQPANEDYGQRFGDEVLNAVAGALSRCVRGGDLLGRWGGDEFVVLGVGRRPEPAHYAMRIHRHLVDGGMDAAKWTPSVSVGVAAMEPPFNGLVGILATAEADMYDRRRARRLRGIPASGVA